MDTGEGSNAGEASVLAEQSFSNFDFFLMNLNREMMLTMALPLMGMAVAIMEEVDIMQV